MEAAPIWLPNATRHDSPWQDLGPTRGRIWPDNVTMAVQHHTDGSTPSVIETFGPKSSRHVSAHILIARNGDVHQFVAFSNIAWHAGNWDANVHSVGIEHEQSRIVDKWGNWSGAWQDWPAIQLRMSAEVQGQLADWMPSYLMKPHRELSNTECPGNLPWMEIERLMVQREYHPKNYIDPSTGLIIYGGMAARWYQLYDLLGPEIFLVVGHITAPERDGTDQDGQPDGSRFVEFEHQTWRWKRGQSPERFDILVDIDHPFIR